ncbi:MAG: NifB/NifX family molybdenum-iron cluster-binding protein [Nitrospirota bacterium]
MKICFPVLKDNGFGSRIHRHFGSAPLFIMFETDSRQVNSIRNSDLHHEYGSCNPMKALNNQKCDAVVVSGIGAGALNKLNRLGIKVFQSQAPTVKENIVLLEARNLPEFTLQHCCQGHRLNAACRHY